MPIENYGVLKGTLVDYILATSRNQHLQLRIKAVETEYRVSVNLHPQLYPSEVFCFIDLNYENGLLKEIANADLQEGYTALDAKRNTLALDFVRKNLFKTEQLLPIPYVLPGTKNEINAMVGFQMELAKRGRDAVVYVFGRREGPHKDDHDAFFHFSPRNEIHDVHLNQGNKGCFEHENGVYQDGGLFIHFPFSNRWVALFIAFQLQAWHTDDRTGAPINHLAYNDPQQPERSTPIRIIAAKLNPMAGGQEEEHILLMNNSGHEIDLDGWRILDKRKSRYEQISNQSIGAGDTLRIKLNPRRIQLSDNEGLITLLNQEGLKVDGVSYTKEQISQEGMLLFYR